MQASVQWIPPTGVLGTLTGEAHSRVSLLKAAAQHLEEQASAATRIGGFGQSLRARPDVALIAEIKRRSPSKGDIAPGLDAGAQASAYALGGAAAISVLTEPSRFGGQLADLRTAREAGIPLLRKDFIVDRLQMLEAVIWGASAILLIARALPPERLVELHGQATDLGLDVLVEVRDDAELRHAVDARFPIVGVNNRNLETLEIDPATGARLLPNVPRDAIAIYESGIRSREDVDRAAEAGADAILVGSALSGSADVAAGVKQLVGVARRGRRGN